MLSEDGMVKASARRNAKGHPYSMPAPELKGVRILCVKEMMSDKGIMPL
ncbi:MAG: hypothetical protein ACI4JW_08025 [Oscillospiraceae bacterium]